MLVHGSLQDEERKLVLDGEKSTFVLSSRQSKKADLRMLSRDPSDPSVLGQLRHLVWVCDARLDEFFGGLAPLVKAVREQARDEGDDPGVGHLSVHAPPGEPPSDDDTRDGIRTMVTQNICGNDGWFIYKYRNQTRGVECTRYLQCSCGRSGLEPDQMSLLSRIERTIHRQKVL
jgi:hypothetical protein